MDEMIQPIDPRLRQLQLCELEILDEFVRICDKFGLKYYLVGGTLLGAIRHQGFIPWDDDIDVAMPREDYDRFAEICKSELKPQYFYQCPQTDSNYFLTYAKIRKNNTEIFEPRFERSKFHKGIFIDVFPLDYCPRPGILCRLLFNVLAVMNYRGQVDSGEEYVPYEEVIGKIGYKVLSVFSPKSLLKVRRFVLALSKKMSLKTYVACYPGAYGYAKEVYPVDWIDGEEKTLVFENRTYRAIGRPENVLRRAYGDSYHLLPPAEKRKSHIDLNYIKYF